MSGAHTREKRWYENQNPEGNLSIADQIQTMCLNVLAALREGEEGYKELLELNAFAGGTTQLLADQLFFEKWDGREADPVGNPGVFDTQANAEEVAMVTDATAAVVAMHELYFALTNQVVAQADREADLRRMS